MAVHPAGTVLPHFFLTIDTTYNPCGKGHNSFTAYYGGDRPCLLRLGLGRVEESTGFPPLIPSGSTSHHTSRMRQNT